MGSKLISIENVKLDKLNRTNYCTWKKIITYLLIHDRTYHVVQCPKPIYEKPGIKDDFRREKKWEDDNLFAKATILSNMNDNLILLYEDCENA